MLPSSAVDLEQRVISAARDLILRTKERLPDWAPPPFDPLILADTLGIPVDFRRIDGWDALVYPQAGGGFQIVCNRSIGSLGRRNFSIAHEICHTFFPDAANHVRHRARKARLAGADDQVEEMLCDRGAAELLMPEHHFSDAVCAQGMRARSIPVIADLFEVSLQATALRMVEKSPVPCASGFFQLGFKPRVSGNPGGSWPEDDLSMKYRVQRVFHSRGFPFLFPEGKSVINQSVIYQASLGNEELQATEEFVLRKNHYRLEVSAYPLHRDKHPDEPPTVCAVFSTPARG